MKTEIEYNQEHGSWQCKVTGKDKEAVTALMTERKNTLEDALSEAFLDKKLGLAMEEADTGEYVSEQDVLSKLSE